MLKGRNLKFLSLKWTGLAPDLESLLNHLTVLTPVSPVLLC